MGIAESEGGLRRRMPLRRAGGRQAAGAPVPGGRAMRYYRLWIYTCNTALLAGALAFAGAAARTLFFDFRRVLVPSLTLYQPSFLYAYLALLTQGGALQLLGCVAALRLSEKLLNAYWLLLLVLLFGDVVLGAFWAFRFERICQELKPALRMRFQQEYASGSEMTDLWHRLQTEDACCGVTGPEDFGNTTGKFEMPASCCDPMLVPPDEVTTIAATTVPHQSPAFVATNISLASPATCRPFQIGCDERLLAYLRSTASVLAILGYCVMAFLKLCFLGILRYEIREMIQKIRILRAELELPPNLNGSVPGALMREGAGAESERESLLLVRPESAAFLSSPPTQPKNPNGNNNYEMREYRSHDNI